MRFILIVLTLFILTADIYAQQKIFIINPGQDILANLPKQDLYAYDQFVNGSVHLKNGKIIEHKMNYNVLFDKIEYINSKEDTLNLTNYNFDFLTVGSDTFYYNRVFYKLLKDYGKIRFISRNTFAFVTRQKIATDTFYESRLAIDNGLILRGVSPKDTVKLTKVKLYYMMDLKNNVQTLRRENLIELFPHRKKELLDFLSKRTVHLNDPLEIEQMLDFITTKKYY